MAVITFWAFFPLSRAYRACNRCWAFQAMSQTCGVMPSWRFLSSRLMRGLNRLFQAASRAAPPAEAVAETGDLPNRV